MPRNSSNRSRRGGNSPRNRNSNPTRDMVMGVAGRYARALINNDEATIHSMTLYTSSGAVGGGSASNKALQNSGAQHVSSIQANTSKGKKTATVLFSGNGRDIACIGVFNVLEGHVLSDWQIFLPA